METGYLIGEVMSTNVLCIGPDAAIGDCARQMAQRKISSAVICENKVPLGIVTEQDLVRRVLAAGLDVATPVSNVMSAPIHGIATDKDLFDAVSLMADRKIKHLPVLKNGHIVGIISFKDIIKVEPDLIDSIYLKSSQDALKQTEDDLGK